MSFLKRIELWLLLAVVLGGLAWVFTNQSSKDSLTGDQDATDASPAAQPLTLKRCTLIRDYGNARLEIDLRVRNEKGEELVMQAPAVKLMAKDREVPSFFLPFDPVPKVPVGAEQDVELRYWLEKADLAGPLTLHVNDRQIAIKSEAVLDLDSVKNGEEGKVVYKPGAW